MLSEIEAEDHGKECSADDKILLNSSRPVIRQKALEAAYELTISCPEALNVFLPKFAERLEDSHPAVLCTAVTVICEVASKKPELVLPYAPQLYDLLEEGNSKNNNWMLIKVAKVMSFLAPIEPRLAKKLVKPLCNILSTTRAKSLLYECAKTVTTGLLEYEEAVELASARIGDFILEKDQNLKYLGLHSLKKLVQARPSTINNHRDLILECLDDDDYGIRLQALELCVVFKSLENIRQKATVFLEKMQMGSESDPSTSRGDSLEVRPFSLPLENGASRHMFRPSQELAALDDSLLFRDALANRLLDIGKFEKNADGSRTCKYLVTDADLTWYVETVLDGLVRTDLGLSSETQSTIAEQLMDLSARTETSRPWYLAVSRQILFSMGGLTAMCPEMNPSVEIASSATSSSFGFASSALSEIGGVQGYVALICSALQILGSYASLLPEKTTMECLDLLVSSDGLLAESSANVQIMAIQFILKLLCQLPECEYQSSSLQRFQAHLSRLKRSGFAEVQERAAVYCDLVGSAFETKTIPKLKLLLDGEFKPVDPRIQSKIPMPEEILSSAPLADLVLEDEKDSLVGKSLSGLSEDQVQGNSLEAWNPRDPGITLMNGSMKKPDPGTVIARQAYMSSPFYLGKETESSEATSIAVDQLIDMNSENRDDFAVDASVANTNYPVTSFDKSSGDRGLRAQPVRVVADEQAPEGVVLEESNMEKKPSLASHKKKKKSKKSSDGADEKIIDLDVPASTSTVQPSQAFSADDLLK